MLCTVEGEISKSLPIFLWGILFLNISIIFSRICWQTGDPRPIFAPKGLDLSWMLLLYQIINQVNLEITTFFFYLRFPYCPNFFWFGVVVINVFQYYDHSSWMKQPDQFLMDKIPSICHISRMWLLFQVKKRKKKKETLIIMTYKSLIVIVTCKQNCSFHLFHDYCVWLLLVCEWWPI